MEKAIIQLSNTEFGYGKKTILKVDEATINPAELNVLIGRNGSGKSTLLRTLLGMIPPISGSVKLDGKDLESFNPVQRSRVVSAVLSGNYQSPTGMKVIEMIALGRSPHTTWWGKLTEQDYEIIHRSAERAGVGHLLQSAIGEISDGERQKVFIARALAQETDLILLDEPMAYLDFSARRELLTLLQELCAEGKSILYSSHDLALSLKNAHKIWVIDEHSNLQVMESSAFLSSGLMEKIFGHQL